MRKEITLERDVSRDNRSVEGSEPFVPFLRNRQEIIYV